MAHAARLVPRSSGIRWGQSEGRPHLLPVTYGLSVLVNAELATRALKRNDLEGGCYAALLFSLHCTIREYTGCILSTGSYRITDRQWSSRRSS